jgi:hypothetical protein
MAGKENRGAAQKHDCSAIRLLKTSYYQSWKETFRSSLRTGGEAILYFIIFSQEKQQDGRF